HWSMNPPASSPGSVVPEPGPGTPRHGVVEEGRASGQKSWYALPVRLALILFVTAALSTGCARGRSPASGFVNESNAPEADAMAAEDPMGEDPTVLPPQPSPTDDAGTDAAAPPVDPDPDPGVP